MDGDQIKWHAMSATYRSELKVQTQLQSLGIECYVAMQTVEKQRRGKKIKVRVPLVSNLIFVRSSRNAIQQVKQNIPHLQFKVYRETGCLPRPITVRDSDMQNFIIATTMADASALTVLPHATFPTGSRVVVVDGPMSGLQGTLVKTAGRKSHNLLVVLDKLVSLQVFLSQSHVELVNS